MEFVRIAIRCSSPLTEQYIKLADLPFFPEIHFFFFAFQPSLPSHLAVDLNHIANAGQFVPSFQYFDFTDCKKYFVDLSV